MALTEEDEFEIDRHSSPRPIACKFCGKKATIFLGDEFECDPECVRAQKLTTALNALTKALARSS